MSELPETAKLPSGAVLNLKDAPFDDAMALLVAIASELRGVSTGLKIELSLSDPVAMIAKLAQTDLPVDLLKDALLQVVASKAISAALNTCMGRCLYDGQAVVKGTFESRKARADYLPAAWEVMRFTLSPFFDGFLSKSSGGVAPS